VSDRNKTKWNVTVEVSALTPKGNRSKLPYHFRGNVHVYTKTRRAALARFKKTIAMFHPEMLGRCLWKEARVSEWKKMKA
jgi:hypothetical protein